MRREARLRVVLLFTALMPSAVFAQSATDSLRRQFSDSIARYGTAEGIDKVRRANAARPPRLIASAINALGYELFRAGRTDASLNLFRVATARLAWSANLHDSQAEIALASGDTALAEESYRAVIALVAGDSTLTPNQREQLKRTASTFLDARIMVRYSSWAPGTYVQGRDTILIGLRDYVVGSMRTQDLVLLHTGTGEFGKVAPMHGDTLQLLRGLEGAPSGVLLLLSREPASMKLVRHQTVQTFRRASSVVQEEVSFSSDSTTRLCGVMTKPANARSNAGVVFVHGSGQGGRYYLTHDLMARYLALRGIVSINYDKRGTGCSSGERYDRVPLERLASDAAAALNFLQARNEVDAARTGFIGRSQGAWISPLAVHGGAPAKFLALIGAPATTTWEQEIDRVSETMSAAGQNADSIARARQLLQLFFDVVAGSESVGKLDTAMQQTNRAPWRRFLNVTNQQDARDAWLRMRHDPAPALRSLRLPVLLLYGENDLLVPPTRNITRWRELATNAQLDVRRYPETDHALIRNTPASIQIGISADSDRIEMRAMRDLAEWLRQR